MTGRYSRAIDARRSPEHVFGHIYASGAWGGGSGHGSRLRPARVYRRYLADFVAENSIRSVVDFGCGDGVIARAVQWRGAEYLGVDVVPELIEDLQAHRLPGMQFAVAPPTFAELPEADLLIVKDVLQHWPNAMISAFLAQAVPRYRFALITNDIQPKVPPAGRVNGDIALGEWRDLDVRAAPFFADAAAVFVFRGPRCRDPRNWRLLGRPVWTKLVLLLQA